MHFSSLRRLVQPTLRWPAVPVLTALYCLLFLNKPLWDFWRTITGAPHTAKLASILFFVAIAGIVSAFLMPLSHPRLVKWPVSLVVLVAAANNYFASKFGTIVDTSMIRNIIETDLREALELMTWPLGQHLLIYAGVPIAILAGVRIESVTLLRWGLKMPLALLIAFLIALLALMSQHKFFQLIFREHREIRLYINPTYPLYSLGKYLTQGNGDSNAVLKQVALDARPPHRHKRKRPLLAIMVVGETARADHFSLNGYERLTNPELMKENVLSFTNAWSCGTSTAESVPCMFSDLGRENYSPDKAEQRQSLLDVLQRIKINVLWIDNNSGSKGVAKRVPQLGRKEFTPQEIQQHCSEDECFDDVLLEALQRSLPIGTADSFVVLHQMGNHGPSYYKRHPEAFRKFEPECQQDDAFNCANNALVNAYDNDIYYTDSILAGVIKQLKKADKHRDVLMLYMSDHGESLGENGVYLHGAPWIMAPDAQKHVPMVLWMSDATYRDLGVDAACLRQTLQLYHDHDNIFHTFLGLYTDHKSKSYQRAQDLLASCRQH